MSQEVTISTSGRISSTEMIMQDGNLDKIKAFSSLMSGSNMVPEHFKGNTYDCAIVVAKALSMGIDPVAMSQEVFPVKGKMTYGSKLIIAMIHNCGMLVPRTFIKTVGDWDKKGRLVNGTFEREDGLGLKVGFKFIGDEQPTWGSVLMLSDQITRNSPLWKTDPQQQLTYLAGKRWSSIHLPGVTMGMIGADEMLDSEPEQQKEARDITPIKTNVDDSPVVDFNACQDAEIEPENEVLKQSIKQTERVEKVLNEDSVVKNDDPIIETEAQSTVASTVQLKEGTTIEQVKEVAQTALKEVVEELNNTETGVKKEFVSPLGVVFDGRYMTGSTLKNGEWRLNKEGKEHFAKLEAEKLKQKTEAIIKGEPKVQEFVKPVSEEAKDFLGTDQPIKVESIPEDGLVKLEGFDDLFPVVDSENGMIHLEFVNNDHKDETTVELVEGEEVSKEIKEALGVLWAQIDKCETGIENLLNKTDLTLDEDQLNEFEELRAVAVENYRDIEKLGSEILKSDLDEVDTSNRKYWHDAKALIAKLEADSANTDNPFA